MIETMFIGLLVMFCFGLFCALFELIFPAFFFLVLISPLLLFVGWMAKWILA